MKNLISKAFAEKVRAHGFYDTRRYRYTCFIHDWEIEWNDDFTDYRRVARFYVKRLPISLLGILVPDHEWQLVYMEVYNND